jgi:hypothetical protein
VNQYLEKGETVQTTIAEKPGDRLVNLIAELTEVIAKKGLLTLDEMIFEPQAVDSMDSSVIMFGDIMVGSTRVPVMVTAKVMGKSLVMTPEFCRQV